MDIISTYGKKIFSADVPTFRELLEMAVAEKINLRNARMENVDLSGANLEGIQLNGVILIDSNLSGANLSNTDCYNV